MILLLFSYGTLQLESVQKTVVGRRLEGHPDELVGFEHSSIPIEDPEAAEWLGLTHYANVKFTGRDSDRIPGTVFEVTEADLIAMDEYEQDAGYIRETVKLASRKVAWVYVCP